MDLFVIFLCFLTFFHFSPLPHLLKNLNKKWYPLENLKICSKWGGIGWTPHWHLKWGVWGVKFYNTSKWGVYLPHFVFENGLERIWNGFETDLKRIGTDLKWIGTDLKRIGTDLKQIHTDLKMKHEVLDCSFEMLEWGMVVGCDSQGRHHGYLLRHLS